MATWVRQGTGTAPTSTDADLVGRYSLDNGTAPGNFDPAAVTSVQIQYTITGTGFAGDTWDDLRSASLDNGALTAATIDGADNLGLGNTASNTNETDNTPNTGLTTGQWELMAVSGATFFNGSYTTWNQDKGKDGGVQTMSALTVTITYTPLPAQVSQTNFRVRTEDTVALNSTTFAAALNINPSPVDVLGGDVTIRLRFEVDEINSLDFTDGYQLRVSKNLGSYDIPANIAGTTSVNSSQYTDGDPTTNILSGSGRTFQAGEGVGADNATGTITALNNEHTELEFAVRLDSASLDHLDTLDFRVYLDDGTALTSYINTPKITISKVVTVNTDQTHYRFRDHANANVALNSASFGVAENTGLTANPGRRFRLRVVVAETAGPAFSDQLKLQYRKNAEAYADVFINNPGSSDARTAFDPVEIVSQGTNYTDQDPTTDVIGGAGTFVAGDGMEMTITTGAAISLNNTHTELEWSLWFHQRDSDGTVFFADGDTIDFRVVTDTGGLLDNYTVTPRVTVEIPDGFVGLNSAESPGHLGPWVDTNNNMYMLVELNGTINPSLVIVKSTDGGLTWAIQDQANAPTQQDLEGIDVIHDGDELLIAHWSTSGTDGVYFHRFGLSDHVTPANQDKWLETDTVVDNNSGAGLARRDQSLSLHQKSNGDLMVLYSYNLAPVEQGYRRRISGTWDTTTTILWNDADGNWVGANGVTDETNDIVYFVAHDDTTGELRGKAVLMTGWTHQNLFADTETAAGTLIDSNAGTALKYEMNLTPPTWIPGTPDRFIVGFLDGTTDDLETRVITVGSGGSVAASVIVNDSGNVAGNIGQSRQPAADIVRDSNNGDLYAFFAREDGTEFGDSTLYYAISTNNGTSWGTDTAASSRSTGSRIAFVRGRFITRSGADYIGFQWYDANLYEEDWIDSAPVANDSGAIQGFVWYDEIALATTVALDGTGDAASDGIGTLTTVTQVSGTGDNASDGTGALGVTRQVAGDGAASSAGQGTIEIERQLVGSGAASSDGSGFLDVKIGLEGTGNAASAGTGSIDRTRGLAGAGASASEAQAALGVLRPLAATGDASSDGIGTVEITRGLAGNGANSSDGTGTISTGAVISLDGAGDAASEGVGTLRATVALAGAGANSSAGTGDLIDFDLMAGAGANASAGAGTLSATLALAGTGSASSDGTGELDAGTTTAIAGNGPASSAGQGTLSASLGLAGNGDGSSAGAGTLDLTRGLTGQGAASSDGTGTILRTRSLAGTGDAASGGFGSLDAGGVIDLAGSGASSAAGQGTLSAQLTLAGAGSSASDGQGAVDRTRGLAGSGASSSDGSGDVTVGAAFVQLDGTGAASSDGTGLLSIPRDLAGTAGSASNGIGSLSRTVPVDGTGNAASEGTATLVASVSLAGAGSNSSDGRGDIDVGGVKTLAGTGSQAADGSGSLSVSLAMAATGDSASAGVSQLTVVRPMAGSAGSASDGSGLLVFRVYMSGSGDAASDGQGTANLLIDFAGTGDAASASTADLLITRGFSGVGNAASGGSANLVATVGMTGPGNAASDGLATMTISGLGSPRRIRPIPLIRPNMATQARENITRLFGNEEGST